ncbi:hypothetical protein [Lucifera butyrica]|nr:hypothetical protein [Lucifera butyrica]
MTLNDLEQLKKECNLDNPDTICNTLVRLSTHGGLKLNSRQVSYIERVNPEFRDQDLAPARLGELLVYGRLFGRGLGVFGRVYLHVFADMYTGHIFGRLSQDKRVSAGLSLLTSTVIPSYQSRNYAIDTILHSTQNDNDIDEINSLKSSFAFSAQSLQWLSTRRNFGVLEKLERYLVQNSFFENPPALFKNLQSRLERRIAKYNASNRWFARRIIY